MGQNKSYQLFFLVLLFSLLLIQTGCKQTTGPIPIDRVCEKQLIFSDSNLENAILEFTGAKHIVCREDIRNASSLDLSGKNIQDLTGVEQLRWTDTMVLNNNPITDLQPVADMESLVRLKIRGTDVTNIDALTNCKSLLIELDISNTDVASLSGLSQLWSLLNFYANNIEVTDFSAISTWTSLIVLELNFNNITDISFLANMQHLMELRLINNDISDITVLENKNNIKWIVLAGNQIEDISALTRNASTNLEFIDLRGNPLNDESINTYIPYLTNREITVFY